MTVRTCPRGIVLLAFLFAVPYQARGAELPPPLDRAEVERLVEEALGANPEIRSARATAAAIEERIRPAGALPDPMVSVTYENDGVGFSLGEEPMTRLSFMAQQAIPFPGKLRLAREVARKDAERAGTVPRRAALTIAASVRRAYADLLEAREGLRLVDEQAETWKGIEDVTRVRYAAGLASQQDVLRAQSERTRLLQQRRREEAAEQTALSQMRQLLFRPPGAPIPTEQRLVPGRLVAVPASAETLARAVDETPELKEIALTKERSKLSADLARRNLKPDFVASAGYMNRGGLPLMWAAGIGVSIPLWAGQKQRPLIVEAETLTSAAAAAEESLRRRILAVTEERLIRLEQLAEEARLDAEGILVQDQLSVDAALASYRTGSVPFVTVLEALGTYFGDRRAALGRLASLIRTQADLEEFSPERSPQTPMASPTAAASASASPKM
jgi:outer membrane protein, heavy metal efflux system